MHLAPKGDAIRDWSWLGDGPRARDMFVADLAVNAVAFDEADLQPMRRLAETNKHDCVVA